MRYWLKNNATNAYSVFVSREDWNTARNNMPDHLAGASYIENFRGERTIVTSNGTRLWI